MSKPSIFSSGYKRKMRKRKKRIAFICFLVVLLSLSFYLYSRLNKDFNISSVKNHIFSIINKKNVNNDKKIAEPKIPKKQPAQNVIEERKPENEDKSYTFKLSDGKEYKAIYEENNGEKKYKNVTGENENLDFNISPSANGIIIYDTGVQSIIYMNLDGVTSDLSKKIHISSSGTKFTKENTIKSNPGYIWAKNAKFIDNENVAYVSQLPWFKKEATKYVWVVNIKNPDNPKLFEEISGANIILGKLEDKGLNISIDGKLGHLKANGELIIS